MSGTTTQNASYNPQLSETCVQSILEIVFKKQILGMIKGKEKEIDICDPPRHKYLDLPNLCNIILTE